MCVAICYSVALVAHASDCIMAAKAGDRRWGTVPKRAIHRAPPQHAKPHAEAQTASAQLLFSNHPLQVQVVDGDGLSYYFDGHHLFVKLVDPGNGETQVWQACI